MAPASFRTQLFLAALSTTVIALVIAGVLFSESMRVRGDAQLDETLVAEARLASELLSRNTAVMAGAPLSDLKSSVDTDLGGILGAGLLALFRVTFGDDGRFMWLEADPALLTAPDRSGAPQSGSMGPNAGPAGSAAPAAPSPPPAKAPAKVPAKLSPPGTTTPGAKP